MTLLPGAYIKKRRVAAGLSLEDVAIGLETAPTVSSRRRAEWLEGIESGAEVLSIGVALLLHERIDFDWNVLVALSAIEAGIAGDAPPICRVCACSERDPCVIGFGDTCSWIQPDLCSVCIDPTPQAVAA